MALAYSMLFSVSYVYALQSGFCFLFRHSTRSPSASLYCSGLGLCWLVYTVIEKLSFSCSLLAGVKRCLSPHHRLLTSRSRRSLRLSGRPASGPLFHFTLDLYERRSWLHYLYWPIRPSPFSALVNWLHSNAFRRVQPAFHNPQPFPKIYRFHLHHAGHGIFKWLLLVCPRFCSRTEFPTNLFRCKLCPIGDFFLYVCSLTMDKLRLCLGDCKPINR